MIFHDALRMSCDVHVVKSSLGNLKFHYAEKHHLPGENINFRKCQISGCDKNIICLVECTNSGKFEIFIILKNIICLVKILT